MVLTSISIAGVIFSDSGLCFGVSLEALGGWGGRRWTDI